MDTPEVRRLGKKVLYPGKGEIPDFPSGTKAIFHYRACLSSNETLLDDSRKVGKNGKPFELLIGKKFSLEMWEEAIQTMRVGEVASFVSPIQAVSQYAMVARTLRNMEHGKKEEHHCCGMHVKEQTVGYADLDDLLKHPEPLVFTLELLSVEHPGNYKKDVWEMDEGERLKAAQALREEGKALYNAGEHAAASERFGKAIAIIEQLMLREKPKEPEWWALEEAKRPLLINFALCKMQLKEYYDAIERTTEVLKHDEANVKALFVRAKAHAKSWDFEEARSDFTLALKLDATLEKAVTDELEALDRLKRQKDKEEAQQLRGKLF